MLLAILLSIIRCVLYGSGVAGSTQTDCRCPKTFAYVRLISASQGSPTFAKMGPTYMTHVTFQTNMFPRPSLILPLRRCTYLWCATRPHTCLAV